MIIIITNYYYYYIINWTCVFHVKFHLKNWYCTHPFTICMIWVFHHGIPSSAQFHHIQRLKIRTTLQIKPSVRKSTIERRRSPTVFIWLITKKGSPIKVNFTHRLINIHNSILLILESKLCIFFRSETSDAWCHQGQTVSSRKTSLAEFETLHCTLGKEEILIAISHLSETEVFKNTLGVHF